MAMSSSLLSSSNSLLEQLQRDANKPGAYQAKIAYAKYLLQSPTEENLLLVERYLVEVSDDNSPTREYKMIAWFLRAKCIESLANLNGIALKIASSDTISLSEMGIQFLEYANNFMELVSKDNNECANEFNYMRVKLITFYQDIDRVKACAIRDLPIKKVTQDKIVNLPAETAEFQYKRLRQTLRGNDSRLCEYIEQLSALRNHPELTDTLEVKIQNQLIHSSLKCAELDGTLSSLSDVRMYCGFMKNHNLNNMTKKTGLISLIHQHTIAQMNTIEANYQARLTKPRYEVSRNANIFMRGFYRLANWMYFSTHEDTRESEATQHRKHDVKTAARHLLSLDATSLETRGEIGPQLASQFTSTPKAPKNFSSSKIRDALSNTPAEIVTTSQLSHPYHRLLNTKSSTLHIDGTSTHFMSLFVKTTTHKQIWISDIHKDATVDHLMRRIQDKEGIPSDQQRLLFIGKKLSHDKTLRDYDIGHDSTLHLVLKLCGD